MRILVTGGAGFIGSNLCQRLLELGHQVIAVDNLITGSKKNIAHLTKNPHFQFIFHDIIKPFSLTISHQLLAIKYIYHLACPTGVCNLTTYGEEMLLTCSLGTKNVLELAREKQAKLLFTSSSEVYGDAKVFPQSEDYTGNVDPIGVRSPYEEGKRFSESLITLYARKYKLDAKIVRVFNTYGPRMSLTDTRVIPRFLSQATSDKPLTVEGDGTQRRTFCYINDLIDGITLAMQKGKRGEVYNLGSDHETSIIHLAGLIIRLVRSKSKVKYVKRPQHDHQRRLPSLEKVKRIGWYAKIGIEKGLKKTIRWYGL